MAVEPAKTVRMAHPQTDGELAPVSSTPLGRASSAHRRPCCEPGFRTLALITRMNDRQNLESKKCLTRYIHRSRIGKARKALLSKFVADPAAFMAHPNNGIDQLRNEHSMGQYVGFELKRHKSGSVCIWLELEPRETPNYVVRWEDSSASSRLVPLTVRCVQTDESSDEVYEESASDDDLRHLRSSPPNLSSSPGTQTAAGMEPEHSHRRAVYDMDSSRVVHSVEGNALSCQNPQPTQTVSNVLPVSLTSTGQSNCSDFQVDEKPAQDKQNLSHASMASSESDGSSERCSTAGLEAEELETALQSLRSMLNSALETNAEQLVKQQNFEISQERLKSTYESRLKEARMQTEFWKGQCRDHEIELTGHKALLMDSMGEADALKKEIRDLQNQLKDARRPGEQVYRAFSARLERELTRTKADLTLAQKTIERLQRSSKLSLITLRNAQENEKVRNTCLVSMEKNRELVMEVESLKAQLVALNPTRHQTLKSL